jgi:site-specific DNA-methyltransferase (adenine-specific)
MEWASDCGRVVLYCGECMDVLSGGIDCDVCITDPPYEISVSGGGIGARRQYIKDIMGFTDCGFDQSVLSKFKNWMCFCSMSQLQGIMSIASSGTNRCMLITWNKPNPCPLVKNNYLPDTEYIVHSFAKGCLYGEYKDRSRYIVYGIGNKEHGEHPNKKPVVVMSKLVSLASDAGHTVCDPFMGSGTTGVVCVRMGRKFIGIEREKKWFDIAKKRIERDLIAIARQPDLFAGPKKVDQILF